jgi:aspartate beta-hydroxylase
MEPRRDDPYDVLGVARGAPPEEITRRHRILSHIFHPDRYQTSSQDVQEEAERRMKTVNAAYDILKRGVPGPPRRAAGQPQRAAREPASREARTGQDEVWERFARETRERAEREARRRQDEVWEHFAREARERAEREARERSDAVRVRAEKIRERVVRDVREAAYQQTRQDYERKARERAEREARERAQRETREHRRFFVRFARRLSALLAGRTF